MGTPTYGGKGQPVPESGSGWLGRLGAFLGGENAPSYAGDGQPSSSGGGFFGGSTPAYAPPPSSIAPNSGCQAGAQADPQALVACPIDADALAAGQIAIVVPRDRNEP